MTFITRATGRIIGGQKRDGSSSDIVGASALMGEPVINAVGESLGEIRDLMIDVVTGRITYAVLEFGGFLGLGDKLFAVPWMALTLDVDNRCFILNVDKRRLKDAPGFDKDHWPTMAQSEWADQVQRFYSAEPFWRYHA